MKLILIEINAPFDAVVCRPVPFDAALVWVQSRIAKAAHRQKQQPKEGELDCLKVATVLKELCASYSQYVGQTAALAKQEKNPMANEAELM